MSIATTALATTELASFALTGAVLAETEELAPLILPIWAFPLIAALAFLFFAFVTWSYRDVSNRHADPAKGASRDDESAVPGHGTGGAH